MNDLTPQNAGSRDAARGGFPWLWLLVAGCVIVILLGLFWPRTKRAMSSRTEPDRSTFAFTATADASRMPRDPASRRPRLGWNDSLSAATPEMVVSNKVSQFGRNRRNIAHALAKRAGTEVPDDVERYFDAVERGDWEGIHTGFEKLLAQRTNSNNQATALLPVWSTIHETFGVAESAHDWPSQSLLDYGNSILDSLRPGMVYVGGTDPGRFIPTLLNETSDGEHHVVLTQNALADNAYVDYVNFLYSDRLSGLTPTDTQSVFEKYIEDARARFMHDQQNPNDPKQLLPFEDVRITDGRVQISGQIAVMAINERLMQALMAKNPDASFAIEHSFALKSTYGDSAPLGPIVEMRVNDPQNVLNSERAAQAADYWRTATQQLLSDPSAMGSDDVRKTYSKMASEQAALLLDRNYPAAAERTYRSALEIFPANPESVYPYTQYLVNQGRVNEAIPVVENAIRNAPNDPKFTQLLQTLRQRQGQ